MSPVVSFNSKLKAGRKRSFGSFTRGKASDWTTHSRPLFSAKERPSHFSEICRGCSLFRKLQLFSAHAPPDALFKKICEEQTFFCHDSPKERRNEYAEKDLAARLLKRRMAARLLDFFPEQAPISA